MFVFLYRSLARLGVLQRDFRSDNSGQIVIIFALSSIAIFAGLGAGIDLATAYAARQKLSEVATLACQYSTRPSVAQTASATYSGTNGFQTYVTAVNAYAASSLTTQHWANATPTGASGAAGQYFTATPAVGGTTAAANAPTNPSVTMQASIPTNFGRILNINSIPVKTTIACQTQGVAPQIVNGSPILSEGFETPCSSYCFTQPNGQAGTIGLLPLQTFPTTVGYTGSHGYKWYIMGYCVETDITGIISATSPEGNHTAELDCDNGTGTAGNSSISTKLYLEAGQYELRYNYRSRVDYPDYDPTYICGSTASDVSWANSIRAFGSPVAAALRTNQINVYLDANLAGTNGTTGSAPLHLTMDGLQHLAGSNLIDMCVYSINWIERSVRVKVTSPGYYWLSFAADGQNDSYGGQIDNIRFCLELCTGSPQDNFPPTWLAANNSGVNKVLFEDTFESPVYTQDPYTSSAHAKAGNLGLSTGVTVVSSCPVSVYPSPPGWPCQLSTGWATAPYNEVVYWMQGAGQGSQYISLQGWNGLSNPSDPLNRAISRPFLLDPGYYNISYNYTSLMDFSYDFIYGTNCTTLPTVANNYSLYGQKHGYDYGSTSPLYAQYQSTNFMNLYMSSGQLVSTPIASAVPGAAPTYTNPDGSITLSPTVPPDGGTIFAAYNASAVNPVLDTCSYSGPHVWTTRSVNVKITKPGIYWITFSTQGDPLTGVGAGAAIDDVKLTALGSPYMSGAPTSALATIPVPAPQPDTSYAPGSFPGYTIVADPFTPPGADQ